MDQLSTFSFDCDQQDSKAGATPAQIAIMESLETLWIAKALAAVGE